MTKEKFDIEKEKNRSFTYILPILGSNRAEFKLLKQCIIGDKEKPEIKNKIFTLYDLSDDSNEWIKTYKNALKNNKLYHYHYKCDDIHTMYVYNVPKAKEENYFKFKKGSYSQFSDSYKRHILSFHNLLSNSINNIV